jgi:flagellar motility protein MotE (MotC chaperone)
MNLLRERGIVRPFLILLFVFLILKGWVLVSLVQEEEGGSCLAEPVSAETADDKPSPRVYDTNCELRVGGLIQRIKEEEGRLEQKAAELEEEERRLQIFSRELLENINDLKKLRMEVQKIHEQIEADENKREKRLVKIYDAMEPDNAAQRLEAMDDSLGSWLLLRINVRKAGQILGAMSPAKASRITAQLRGEDPKSAEKIERALKSNRAKTGSEKKKGSKNKAARAPQPKAEKVAKTRPNDTANERLLQIATFSEPQRAERVVQALKQKGYRSFQKEWLQGEPQKAYYKVFVGPFPSETKASETKARLEKKEGFRGIMIRTNAAAGV